MYVKQVVVIVDHDDIQFVVEEFLLIGIYIYSNLFQFKNISL
jgi:hypothetical protein